MANLLWRFSATFVDDNPVKAAVSQYALVPEAQTSTQMNTLLGIWATAVANCSDATLIRVEASLVLNPATLTITPGTSDEEVGEIAGFAYNLHGSLFTDTAVVVAFSEALESGGKVLLTASQVIALDSLLAGPIATTGFFCSPEGLQYGSRRSSFLGTRKHRQQQHSKSNQLG